MAKIDIPDFMTSRPWGSAAIHRIKSRFTNPLATSKSIGSWIAPVNRHVDQQIVQHAAAIDLLGAVDDMAFEGIGDPAQVQRRGPGTRKASGPRPGQPPLRRRE
ncbi:MAG: hypothetical protein R3E68_09680 [Burkholderiaceae bacterium]